jgi:hypothetical protein
LFSSWTSFWWTSSSDFALSIILKWWPEK